MTMKRIVLLLVVMYASLTCMAIELKNLRDNCVVKNSDGWYYLRTRLIWFDEYPELQKELTRVLFDREQTSVKQGYSQYVNSFRSIKSARENMNKAHGKEIQITLQMASGIKGRFMSLVAKRKVISKTSSSIISKDWALIYDEINSKILRADDVFTEEFRQQHLQNIPDSSLRMILSRDAFEYSYHLDRQYRNYKMSYELAEKILSSNFKELVEYDKLLLRATERDSARKVVAMQEIDTTKIYDKVEQMPEYPGGLMELSKFISEHYKYPEKPLREGIDGNVIVTFVVERDGSISQEKVAKAVEPHLDKEALRLVRKFPRWKPGKQKGIPVRVKYTYPFRFRLQPRD